MSNVRVIAEQVFAGTGAWILEATLELTDNTRVKRHSEIVSIGAYRQFFVDQIRSQSSVVFHSGNIFPDDYAAIRAVTFVRTDDRATVDARLTPADQPYRLNRFAFWVASEWPFGTTIERRIIDPVYFANEPVLWRNYEASR